MQQALYFFSLPHGHGSLRPTLGAVLRICLTPRFAHFLQIPMTWLPDHTVLYTGFFPHWLHFSFFGGGVALDTTSCGTFVSFTITLRASVRVRAMLNRWVAAYAAATWVLVFCQSTPQGIRMGDSEADQEKRTLLL